MVCIWLLTTNGFAQNTIKGDGNIITKEISISDYDEISYVGKVNIKYEVSVSAMLPLFFKQEYLALSSKKDESRNSFPPYSRSLQGTFA